MPAESTLPQNFTEALRALTDCLGESQVPYVIIGGVAVSFVAQPRATQDIDSVVWLDHEEWPKLVVSAARPGLTPRIDDALEFAAQSRVLLLRHDPTQVEIDLSFGATPFEREMIDRANSIDAGRITIRIPAPEDLVIMKAIAGRKKDYLDIASILEVRENLDLERIRYWVREFAEVLETPEMVDSLERLL